MWNQLPVTIPNYNPYIFGKSYTYQGVIVKNYGVKKMKGYDYFVFLAQKEVEYHHLLYGRVTSSFNIEQIIPNRIFIAKHIDIELGSPFRDLRFDENVSFFSFSMDDFTQIKFYNYYLTSEFADLKFEHLKVESENEDN